MSKRARRGGGRGRVRRRRRREPEASKENRDSPSFRLARSVLELYTSPSGVLASELHGNLGIGERAFRYYLVRLKRVLAEFLPVEAKLVAKGRGEDRRFCIETPIGAPVQWELVARLAAHNLIASIFRFMGNAEIARQIDLAERELLGRIEGGFASGLRKNFSRMFYVIPDAPKDYSRPDCVARINVIVKALCYRRRIRIHYTTPGKKVAVHEVEPLTLGLHRSALYLFARFRVSEKVYNFAIDRISKVVLLEEHYTYPPTKEWSPEHHFERTFGVFTPPSSKQQAIDVDLVFENLPWLKAHIRERRWMPDQRVNELPDGRLRLRFRVNSVIELRPWVSQWDGLVEVRAPVLE